MQLATQNIILIFLSKWHFSWKCKYGNLCNRDTFLASSLYALGVHR